MNGIHKIGSDGGGTVSLTVPSTSTNTTATLQSQDGTVALIDNVKGFKNFILNGDMRVAQRGYGPFTTNGYNVDQWFSYINGTSYVQRAWNGTGVNHPSYAHVSVGAGTDTITMEQRLEHPHKYSGKTLTLSMMLFNGSYTGTNVPYEIALSHAGGRTSLFTGNITFSSTSRVSVTFTVPDLSGYTLNVSSYLEIRPVSIINRGYTGVFGIRDIQLEEGSVATPFEQRPYGLELSLCQRYYRTYISYNTIQGERAFHTRYTSSGSFTFIFDNIPFGEMRVKPTVSLSCLNGSTTRVPGVLHNGTIETDWNVYQTAVNSFTIWKAVTAVANVIVAFDATLSAEL